MSNTTTALLELRRHYESLIAQSKYQGADAAEMLRHIDALLVNELIQTKDLDVFQAQLAPQELPALPSASKTASIDSLSEAEPLQDTSSDDFISEVESSQEQTSDRTPRTLQPAYAGLKRLEAIAQALQTTPGQDMTIDSLIRELFGDLSPLEQKSERKRLNTLLYKGEKEGLWKKGKAPSSYRIGKTTAAKTAPKPTAETTASTSETPPPAQSSPAASKTTSTPRAGQLQLLPEFEGMNKLEAISKVLSDQAGQVLHQDSIIQLLYGDLSPEAIKAETRKMRASLFQGAAKGLWQKAPKQPSSYLVKTPKARKTKSTEAAESAAPEGSETSTAKPGRKPGRPKAESAPVSQPKQASRGREQVLSLPAEFEGLSKIDAVAKVLSDNSGTVMHIEDIIERFYGELSKDELKAEKDRMKDVMNRGVKRGLWSKASGVPSSFVAKG